MHIKKIYTYTKDIGFSKPYTISFKRIDKVVCAFVQVELENGIIGYGSGIPSVQVVKESLKDCMAALSLEKLSFLTGKDIRNFPAILELLQTKLPRNPSAKAALDIALHDAYTKWLDVPLHSYLGRRIDKLPTSVTIGIKGVKDSLDDAENYVQQGFKVLKIKLGSDPVTEINRLERIRKQYPDILIRVDANQAFDRQSFLAFYRACSQLGVEFYEQPLNATDISAMRALPEEIRRVTAADESCVNTKDAFQLGHGDKAFGIFNIKLMKSGGISQALKIADLATLSGVKLMFGCNNESAISVTAALHTAYSCSNTAFIDLDGAFNMTKDEALAGFDVVDGFLIPKDLPGLGFSII